MNRRTLHYRIERLLGTGASGEVFLARDEKLHRDVVLKFLSHVPGGDAERLALLQHEARSLARLAHPHIAAVYALETQDSQAFLVMEYVDGETLAQVLHLGPLPFLEVAGVGLALAEALAHAHERSVVHRDVKPDNVLISVDSQIRLTDFGIAALEGPRGIAPTVELSASAYLSPEQARGEPLDGRSDQYSLGVVLYEALAGECPPPWRPGLPDPAAPAAITERRPGTPPALAAIVHRCLQPEPAARFATTSDLVGALRAARAAMLPRPAWRHWRAAGAWTAAALACAAAVMLTAGRFDLGPLADRLDPELVLVSPARPAGPGFERGFVADAFSESFCASLAQQSRLRVHSGSAMSTGSSDALASALWQARRTGAGRLVTCSLERDGADYRGSLAVHDTRTRRLLYETTRTAADNRLPMLVAELSSEVTKALGEEPHRRYEWFLYSLGSAEVAASPEGRAALEAARGDNTRLMLERSDELLQRRPQSVDARVLRAYALLVADWSEGPDNPELRSAFERSLADLRQVDPENPWDDELAALMASRDGHLVEAVAGFSGVLANPRLTPSARGMVLSLRGQAYRDRGDATAALRDVEEAVALDATNEITLTIAADALGTFGRPREGLARARQAVAIAPSRPQPRFALAVAYGRLGRWREAMEQAAEVNRHTPAQEYLAFEALAALRCGMSDTAERLAEQARRRTGSSWGQCMLARYEAAQGRQTLAMRLLEHSFEMGFADPELARMPEFDALRPTERFQALWSRMQSHFAAPIP